MKKIFSLVALLLVAMFVTACGGEETRTAPSADVSVICKAYLHGDEASLKKIGVTKEEYDKKFIQEFSKSFTESSGINFSAEQIEKVNAAMRDLLSRSTFEVTDVSTNGDNATVKVTVSTLSPFDSSAILGRLPENVSTFDENARTDAIANVIAELIKEWQYSGNDEFNVECNYAADAKMWVPVKVEEFGVTITQKIFGIK